MPLLIDIVPNSNTAEAASRIFNDAGPAREISTIVMPFGPFEGKECTITGWSADAEAPCPAFCQRIEDSGDAFAYLIFGGNGGIRLKPASDSDPWDTFNSAQLGETYFVVDSDRYVR